MYVDESGCTNINDGRYFVISGVIINECNFDDIKSDIALYKYLNFKDEYKGAEIHVYNIWQGKPPFNRIDKPTKKKLLDKLYKLLYNLPFTIVSVVINKHSMLSGNYINWQVNKASWTFLTERFDRYISENRGGGSKGLLIVDKQPKQIDNEIRDLVNDLLQNGSLYRQYRRILEEPLFVTSYNRVGLQIADAISYCTLKHFYSNADFEIYWNYMETKYRKNPKDNNIYGYALKIFPNESETI
jgi:uncharacterized protein DUF3800